MKKYSRTVAGIVLMLLTFVARVHAEDVDAPARAAIQKTAEAFVEAFHNADAKAVAAFWTPDGDYTDQTGRALKGRQAIEDEFKQFFAENKGLKVRIEVGSLQFPAPDVAVEDGVSSVMTPDGAPPSRARYTNILVKKDDKWMLSSVREAPYEPPNNSGHLRPLAWVIGEWVDDATEGHIGHVLFEWSPDQNFILSLRAVEVKDAMLDSGSQRIGWDPVIKKIRSWNFETDGGFGESTWTQDGNKWIIKTSSVLRSGAQMLATNIVTRIDADTITWQATEQLLNGQPLPDSNVIKMKRVKQP